MQREQSFTMQMLMGRSKEEIRGGQKTQRRDTGMRSWMRGEKQEGGIPKRKQLWETRINSQVHKCTINDDKETARATNQGEVIRKKEEHYSDEFARAQYWMSPEARILFGFDDNNSPDVAEGLNNRIELLKRVNQSELGYELVLKMTEFSATV